MDSVLNNEFKIVKINELEQIFQLHLTSLDLTVLSSKIGLVRFQREIDGLGIVQIDVKVVE